MDRQHADLPDLAETQIQQTKILEVVLLGLLFLPLDEPHQPFAKRRERRRRASLLRGRRTARQLAELLPGPRYMPLVKAGRVLGMQRHELICAARLAELATELATELQGAFSCN